MFECIDILLGSYLVDRFIKISTQLNKHFHKQIEYGMFQHLWWMQDGAPAHKVLAVRQRLAKVFGNRVVALYHDVEWPPRSPNLISWGFIL